MRKFHIALIASTLLISGCVKELDSLIQDPTIQQGLAKTGLSQSHISSIAGISKGVASASEDFTPEQEYYIGRTVSANILSNYKLYNNAAATKYINQIGYQLANHSDMPVTFGGYHFAILDSSEINAFAAPGGFIFITRGLLRCASNEDEVAAIIAHEIAHITHAHALSAIKSSRWSDLGVNIATEIAKKHTKSTLNNLLTIYEGSIKDITNTMINSGYSKSQEYEADKSATDILISSGYNPTSLIAMLESMDKKLTVNSGGFGSTHPSPKDRIDSLTALKLSESKIHANRVKRFKSTLSKI